ncbi:TIGR02391 family protein [Enterococcus hirae]|uniref:TIGR02391 family protein n=1 Tax=Enterococcus hirae TaxID=1354 RepID=UPI001E5BDBBE|nr:TIGR02391 family protein [Enterococcus hirae]
MILLSKPIDNALIEEISIILADVLTGSKITTMFQYLNFKDFDQINNLPTTSTKWRRLNETISYHCSVSKNAKPLFKVTQYVMQPQKFIDKPELWKSTLKAINSKLIFYGFELNDSGKIIPSVRVDSFSEAQKRLLSFQDKLSDYDIHEQTMFYCKEEFLKENYFHAIFEASKGLLNRVRSISELTEDGSLLIDKAFILKRPVILIKNNMLSTLTEKSEYNGLKSLLNTIVYLYRNPQAHEPKLYNPKSETDAITAFTLISLAHRILDNCINVRDISSS